MPNTSLDHKAALDPVLHQVYARFLAQAVTRGELRALPLATGEYVLFDDPDHKAWFKTLRAQLLRLLTKNSDALTIDLEWLDAPLLEAIWKARQGDAAPAGKPSKKEPGTVTQMPNLGAETSGATGSDTLNERSA